MPLKMSQKKLAVRSPVVFKCIPMNDEAQRIAEQIQAERDIAGLSQAHCARAMGWTHKQWQRLEDGERKLKADELRSIATILGVTVARLMGEQPLVVPGYQKRGRRAGTSMGEGGDGGLGE